QQTVNRSRNARRPDLGSQSPKRAGGGGDRGDDRVSPDTPGVKGTDVLRHLDRQFQDNLEPREVLQVEAHIHPTTIGDPPRRVYETLGRRLDISDVIPNVDPENN